MNTDDQTPSAETILTQIQRLNRKFFAQSQQAMFFHAPGPSVVQLAELSGQCTGDEWLFLCRNSEFLDAACKSIEESAAVASNLLGRAIEIKTEDKK